MPVPTRRFSCCVDRVLRAHQAGLLFVLAVGGGAEAQAALADADREAPNQNHLGVYQLGDDGRLLRVRDGAWHLWSRPSRGWARPGADSEEVPDLIERGRSERVEAAAFAQAVSKRFPRLTFGLIAVCFLVFAFLEGSACKARR